MQVKTQLEDFENYLADASNLKGGHCQKLFVPETSGEISEILRGANEAAIPVTISGARTGTVGGAIPFGGYVISLEKLNKIEEIRKVELTAIVQPGVILSDFQKVVEAENLFYPPDPTEWSCQIGGTIATNASGARSFKYGATRNYVQHLKIVLANGENLELKRGEIRGGTDGIINLITEQGNSIKINVPTYKRPNVRKNVSGYFSEEGLDAIDLFIGSEGTLGVITEIKFSVLPKPEGFFSGIVFFSSEENLLSLVSEVRDLSFANRTSHVANTLNASLIEYFDANSLEFIREKFPETPKNMTGAIFFEQETNAESEDGLLEDWNELLEKHGADLDRSWFTTTETDREKMRAFRHALPVAVNERISRHNQKKVGTDMAVPDENFAGFLRFYKQMLRASGLDYVIFGHIGDNHLHANILPKNDLEAEKARHLYGRSIAQAIMLGGTISAEHGIGKLKSKYLNVMMGERYLNEMAGIKKAFDPKGILGRNNMFDAKLLG
ncbi:MAG: FAD-binding oxidoreductase [Saprospiraceae bacterium]|nr:FAD-binding oxidoreductase [Pyrinomonadaceae bacterium]